MAMDSLRCEERCDCALVVARDGTGAVRGFLHFVPSYGRAAMSLSAMRRERETPNGLMEFLVVQSIELLRDAGVEELSLNFAAFARFMHAPRNPAERLVGRLARAREPVLPDREPVPLQREVPAALGAALPRLRAHAAPAAGRPGGPVGGGPAAEARPAAVTRPRVAARRSPGGLRSASPSWFWRSRCSSTGYWWTLFVSFPATAICGYFARREWERLKG